ncbi:helix-turn-helix domain containing protein [Microbacter sp. GSS18]|nr:helix-turn-helix domain containing protein [Microbacter sp. GSS18]
MTGTVATPTPTPRREATRRKLLDAAAQVFAEVGLDAASVEAVCERAGFTRGAFYSNFETKEELFLELAGRVARARVAAVRERIGDLEGEADFASVPANALDILQRILDVSFDDRVGVLLMSEIRNHALRSPDLAQAYLAQEDELSDSVAQIMAEIADARGLTFRLPVAEAASLMLTVWERAAVRAVMAGVDQAEVRRRTNHELASAAQLLIEA